MFLEPLGGSKAQMPSVDRFGESLDVDRLLTRCDQQQMTAPRLVTQEEVFRLHRVRVGDSGERSFARKDRLVIVSRERDTLAVARVE